jgi:hypothetical protein
MLLGVHRDWHPQDAHTYMKIIEALIAPSALDDFCQCAKQLGIYAFDLSEQNAGLSDRQCLVMASESAPRTALKLKVDFAVPDDETKLTVHAILELVHPDSIGIFKFGQEHGSAAR